VPREYAPIQSRADLRRRRCREGFAELALRRSVDAEPIAEVSLDSSELVLTVSEVKERYYVMQFENLLGENEYFVGSRATGSEAGSYLLVGPSWEGDLPDGFADTLRFETDVVYLVGRTQLFSPEDKAALAKVMAQYKFEPLEVYNGGEAPAIPDTDWPVWDDAALSDERFVGLFNRLLEFTGPIDPPGRVSALASTSM
jgi:hypothetical protein